MQRRNHRSLGHTESAELVFAPYALLCLVVYIEMSASLHGSAEWPHAGMPGYKEDETGGRWACHLSLFDVTERVPDVINVLQMHGHNVQ